MARGFWVHLGGSVPAGWHDAVLASQPPVIEPPVVQGLAALLYRVSGGEHLGVVRLLLAATWIAAAPAVWSASARLSSRTAAVTATAVWCLAPYGVAASRSFQPDGLMTVLIASTVWAVVRDDDVRTGSSRWLAVGLGAAAVFVKLVAAFTIVPLLVLYVLRRRREGDTSWRRPAVDVGAALAPGVGFLLVGMASGLLDGQEGGRVFPELLARSGFWTGWGEMALRVGGGLLLFCAVVGVVWARGRAGATVASLGVGYVAFGVVFTYHYRSHDYYHLPLVLFVAMGVGLFADKAVARLRDGGASPAMAFGGVGALLVVGLVLTNTLYPYVERAQPPVWEARVVRAAQIGEALQHSTSVVVSGPAYGQIEEYYGGIAAAAWPEAGDIQLDELSGRATMSAAARLDELQAARGEPFTWFVIADRGQYDSDPDLRAFLDGGFTVGARGDGWWAYRLDEPLPPA